MEPINITRNQESYLHADFDVIFQNHINEDTISPQQPHIVFLPPLNTPLFINLSIFYDDILICMENTPNLFGILNQLIQHSNIWDNLHFKKSIIKGNKNENITFVIKLNDDLFDVPLFNDLLLSPSEQLRLNNLKMISVKLINIRIQMSNHNKDFGEYWISGEFIEDLNFLMFNSFISLENAIPLIFNYVSRSTYLATKNLIPSIISSCLKSNETYVIEQRSILSGLIKSLSNCQTWNKIVNEWDHKKLKNEFDKIDGFTITWFNSYFE